jgi:hypothetical protein
MGRDASKSLPTAAQEQVPQALPTRRIERAQDLLRVANLTVTEICMAVGPPLSPEAAAFVRGQLESGQMGGLGLRVDDCRKTYEQLSTKGVTFLQEPSDRPYGVEAVMRDNTGNWLVLVEPKEFSPDDFS